MSSKDFVMEARRVAERVSPLAKRWLLAACDEILKLEGEVYWLKEERDTQRLLDSIGGDEALEEAGLLEEEE